MASALAVTCPRCGQEVCSGVIADKNALGGASEIRVHCTNCDSDVHVNIDQAHPAGTQRKAS